MEYLDRYDVPEEVKEAVNEYFNNTENSLPGYTVVEVTRHSDHPDDSHLYHVIAKKDKEYSFGSVYDLWTSWNQSTKSLNCGHYNLTSLEMARDISNEKYFTAQPVKRSRGR